MQCNAKLMYCAINFLALESLSTLEARRAEGECDNVSLSSHSRIEG